MKSQSAHTVVCPPPAGIVFTAAAFRIFPLWEKTKIILENRKMFCVNPDCPHTTFVETFAFLPPKGKKSRRVIDLLPSREIEDVVEWLKTYPNLSIVSRDGFVSYHSAISQANTAIVQISDRFHLLKGFIDATKKFLTRFLSANFRLPQETSNYAGTGSSDYCDKDGKEDFPTREHNQTLEKKKALVKK